MTRKQDETDIEPGYERIPRDAAGNPVFLILSDADQQRYDRWMKSCEAGWRATGDPWVVAEAHTLTRNYRQVPSDWVDEAVCLLACKRRTKVFAKRALEASHRFSRYRIVHEARKRGLKRDDALDYAVAALAGTMTAAKRDEIEKAYKDVRKDIKAGRFGRYFTPKYQHRDRPSGQPSSRKPSDVS
jgi:hypothetical protein